MVSAGKASDAPLVDAALGPLRGHTPDRSTAKWISSLARQPRVVGRRLGELAGEARKIAAGMSALEPDRRDRRFADVAWAENPLLKRLLQLYLASGHTLDELVADADLNPRDHARVTFLVENLMQALAPSNVPLVNPSSAKAVVDTGGLSLIRGGKQLVKDLSSSPRIPEMVDSSGFAVGENIAASPGAVVFRNDVLELIQYQPLAEQVYSVPALIVPPTINKYYAVDLAPGRSLVEFGAQQGRQNFVISWRNPTAEHSHWNFDTYVRAILEALDVVNDITGSTQTILGGICSGGILAAITAGYLAAVDQVERLAGLCLAVTVIDDAGIGTLAALSDNKMAARAKAKSAAKGYLDGNALAEVFAWLRPGDLIWNYWVNNYLLGKRPPALDLLFWNSDTTRMAAGLHADFIDAAVDRQLTRPGALKVLGVPIDLGAITVDSYIVAGLTDHITPWQSCYRTTELLGGASTFVLSNSGHVAAMVNPPGNPKSTYRTGERTPPGAETWLSEAETHQGTWWTDLSVWLDARCGELKPAPGQLGSATWPPIADAPGAYVFEG